MGQQALSERAKFTKVSQGLLSRLLSLRRAFFERFLLRDELGENCSPAQLQSGGDSVKGLAYFMCGGGGAGLNLGDCGAHGGYELVRAVDSFLHGNRECDDIFLHYSGNFLQETDIVSLVIQ